MKWILRFKDFTANIVKVIHIVIHPKPKKELKYGLAVWESRHINSCRLTALKLDIIVVRKLLYLLEKPGCEYLDVFNI